MSRSFRTCCVGWPPPQPCTWGYRPQLSVFTIITVVSLKTIEWQLEFTRCSCQVTINWDTLSIVLGLARPVLSRKLLTMKPPRAHLKKASPVWDADFFWPIMKLQGFFQPAQAQKSFHKKELFPPIQPVIFCDTFSSHLEDVLHQEWVSLKHPPGRRGGLRIRRGWRTDSSTGGERQIFVRTSLQGRERGSLSSQGMCQLCVK